MAFPAPRAPNFLHCRNDLAHPVRPQFSDCVSAFHDLPTGSRPVLWDNTGSAQDLYAFPCFAGHGGSPLLNLLIGFFLATPFFARLVSLVLFFLVSLSVVWKEILEF